MNSGAVIQISAETRLNVMRLVLMMLCNVSAVVDSSVYSNVGHVLSAACWAESSSGSSFRWIVLYKFAEEVSVETASILGKAECAYESMNLDYIQRFSGQIPSTDYKLIAFGLSTATLRESFRKHVSARNRGILLPCKTVHDICSLFLDVFPPEFQSPLKFKVALFCQMLIGISRNASDEALGINFSVPCCQGFLISREEDTAGNDTQFIVEVSLARK